MRQFGERPLRRAVRVVILVWGDLELCAGWFTTRRVQVNTQRTIPYTWKHVLVVMSSLVERSFSAAGPEPVVGCRYHLYPHLFGMGVCRVRAGRVLQALIAAAPGELVSITGQQHHRSG